MTQPTQTPVIVNKYLETTGLSMRKFSRQLGISHAAISNWASGKSEPDVSTLLNWRVMFCDWRLTFATEILNAMIPGFIPETPTNGNGHKPAPCEEEGEKQ